MKKTTIGKLSIEQLAERFEAVCLRQDDALLNERIQKYNNLFREMLAITEELERRGSLTSLSRLFDHPNQQVRMQAAWALVEVFRKSARLVFEEIVQSRRMPHAAYAADGLHFIDQQIAVEQLSDVTSESLVEQFAEKCIAKDKAFLRHDTSKYLDFADQKTAINRALKQRGDEALLLLLALYEHCDMRVRLERRRQPIKLCRRRRGR
jgi:HEAT repeat protein